MGMARRWRCSVHRRSALFDIPRRSRGHSVVGRLRGCRHFCPRRLIGLGSGASGRTHRFGVDVRRSSFPVSIQAAPWAMAAGAARHGGARPIPGSLFPALLAMRLYCGVTPAGVTAITDPVVVGAPIASRVCQMQKSRPPIERDHSPRTGHGRDLRAQLKRTGTTG